MINRCEGNSNLIWIDLEMTGLDFDQDRIIEIATVVTNSELDIIAEGPVFAIKQADQLLDGMDKWNTKQHNKSGLVQRVKDSAIDEQKAEAETIKFLQQYVSAGQSPMCGSSICTDRRYLYRYMPALENYFHYRHIDVSTIKELAVRWYGSDIVKGFKKSSTHLALDDIRESIDELKYYRQHLFAEQK
ncbi:MAG: oligoribonuclease [Pseudomonadota bacterium]